MFQFMKIKIHPKIVCPTKKKITEQKKNVEKIRARQWIHYKIVTMTDRNKIMRRWFLLTQGIMTLDYICISMLNVNYLQQ